MKKAFLLTALFLTVSGINAQDTIRAINIFSHHIVNGKNTPDRYIIEQQTFNKESQLILKVNYIDSVPVVKTFTRYFYDDNGRLISEELYTANGDIIEVKRYTYKASGMVTTEKIWEPAGNSMANSKSFEYTYSDGMLTAITVLDERGKWLEKHIINRIDSTETTSIKYSKKHPEQLTTEVIVKTFSGDKLSKKTCTKVFKDKRQEITEAEYSYNKQGKLSEQLTLINGEFHEHLKFSWYSKGTINSKRLYNENEELIEYYHFSELDHQVNIEALPMFDLSKPLNH